MRGHDETGSYTVTCQVSGHGLHTPAFLRAAALARFPTIKDAAAAACVHSNTFHSYLQGRSTPHPRRVPAIATALGCDAAELLAAVTADRQAGEQSEDGQEAGACAQSAEMAR